MTRFLRSAVWSIRYAAAVSLNPAYPVLEFVSPLLGGRRVAYRLALIVSRLQWRVAPPDPLPPWHPQRVWEESIGIR